jgi:hypothetical protein
MEKLLDSPFRECEYGKELIDKPYSGGQQPVVLLLGQRLSLFL